MVSDSQHPMAGKGAYQTSILACCARRDHVSFLYMVTLPFEEKNHMVEEMLSFVEYHTLQK